MDNILIEVKDLQKHFKVKGNKVLKAVDGINISIKKGETFGLVGESGCGKSTLGRTITKLYDATGGSIIYEGKDITNIKGKKLKEYQKKMQIIFQDPYSSLNPNMSVKEIIMEPIKIHTNLSQEEIDEKIKNILKRVGLTEDCLEKFPHEFSGGQRQRIGIGRALSVEPDFILCDEPISALDVSVQAQVVNTLKEIQEDIGITYLFVAHDLSMVKYVSDRIGVMYLGNIVEIGYSNEIYNNPLHPYTRILLDSIPEVGKRIELEEESENKGDIIKNIDIREGCRFKDRCIHKMPICESENPKATGDDHKVACHLYK